MRQIPQPSVTGQIDGMVMPSFTNDDSLRRMLYLDSQRIIKHWHARCQNWDMVLNQLQIMFTDRAVG